MTLELPGGVRTSIQVRGEETGGAFTMLTDSAPPGWSLPPHRHARESETIHVTAGRLWMIVGERSYELGPGESVHIPAGVRHEGGTTGPEPVERVVIFAPAGMEEFFEALAATTDTRGALDLAAEYGWDFG